MLDPCPHCGSKACAMDKRPFCRHSGKLRIEEPIMESVGTAPAELATESEPPTKTAVRRRRR